MRKCRICGHDKEEINFAFTGYVRKRDGIRTRKTFCLACAAKSTANWRRTHPGAAMEANANWRHRERFKHSLQASRATAKRDGYVPCISSHNEIQSAFSGSCDICERSESDIGRRLHLDHCHTTGQFRFWLCGRCNVMLGMCGDSPEILERAAKMIRNFNTKPKRA
jgi:hypothetical protein